MLTLVGERFFVECLHDDFDLFFENLTVGVTVSICAGHAEGVHLTGVVTAAYSEDDPPSGEDVCGGVVLGQPQGVPHGIDVEPTTELQVLGQVGHVDVHQQ